MRIAYLGQMADVSCENGVSKKIRSQMFVWRQGAHDVRYFSLTPSPTAWPGLAPIEADLLARGSCLQRLWRSFTLVRRIQRWAPDIIYFRYAYHSPGLPALFRSAPTVAEINSDDLTEYKITLSRARFAYHRLTRRRLLDSLAALVPVTHELASRFEHLGKPAEVIANGIDLDSFAPIAKPDPAAPLRLVFVGSSGTPWHGLDRIAELARLLPHAQLDVIGCTADDLRQFVGEQSIPASVRFHGAMPRAVYEPLLAAATAAVGTMALFRKNMEEACPLKVREYLALGLPVIAAYNDTDIPASADYFLRLPNSRESLASCRANIERFLSYWRGRRVPREAIAHIDIGVKERRRLAFLQRFTRPNPA